MPNFYGILGLTAGAAPEQVKVAFHALAKSSHPDVNTSDATAANRFKEINEAYEILGDPEKRAVYDLGLRHERADTRWRFWNTMVVTTASFTIMMGGGLYFLLHHGERSFAHAREATNAATNTGRSMPQPKGDNLPEPAERSAKASSTELSESGRASAAPPMEAERILASAPSPQPAIEPPVPGRPIAPSVADTGKASVAIATSGPSSPTPIPRVEREQAPPPSAEPPVEVRLSTPATDQPEKSTVMTGASGRAPSTPDPQAERAQALHLYTMGMEHIGRGDVVAARSLFLLAAKKGSVRSMRAPKKFTLAADLARFRAAYLSGDGLAYVVVNEETGEQIYRYGDPSRSKAKKNAQYTLFLCDTPHIFSPREPEDLAALLRATVVSPWDSEFDQLDAKYLSICRGARSAIPRD